AEAGKSKVPPAAAHHAGRLRGVARGASSEKNCAARFSGAAVPAFADPRRRTAVEIGEFTTPAQVGQLKYGPSTRRIAGASRKSHRQGVRTTRPVVGSRVRASASAGEWASSKSRPCSTEIRKTQIKFEKQSTLFLGPPKPWEITF